MNSKLINDCNQLLSAYKAGELGQTKMPEDSNPGFSKQELEQRFSYFSLPMALNYQRDSYTLWENALKTYNDTETKDVFDVSAVVNMSESEVREKLQKYKLALQPNKHIATWMKIATTISNECGSFEDLLEITTSDFLSLKNLVQIEHKKGFPYLSGPKIFNYWSFILGEYCDVSFTNKQHIGIAPDTHITKCSVKLGVITEAEASLLSRDDISERWRLQLEGSDITPIEMHSPLWFWSKNGFIYDL